MKSIIALFIFTLSLFSCSTNKKIDTIYFVIKHPKETKQDFGEIPPPPPMPKVFYGYHNFILLDSSRIFYHHRYIFYRCGTGLDLSKPPMLFLTPDSLMEIKIENLPRFLATTINKSTLTSRGFPVVISSPTDTIRNSAYKVIVDYLKRNGIKSFDTRNWTEEEKYTSIAKMLNKKYDPKNVNWEIGFDGPKFIPPTDIIDGE